VTNNNIMSFLIRVFQQIVLFLSVYATLFFWGNDVYIKFNNIIFFLTIATCLIQPLINCLWTNKLTLYESVFFISILTIVFVPICFIYREILYMGNFPIFIVITYIYLRLIERFVYVRCCQDDCVYIAQKKLLKLYLTELVMISIFFILFKDDKFSWEYNRLLPAIISFMCVFIYFRRQLINEYYSFVESSERSFYFFKVIDEYRKSFFFIFYFLFCIITLNVDRYLLDDLSRWDANFSASYLFYLSIFLALFGLVTYSFDQLRKDILDGVEINFLKVIVFSFSIFFIVEVVVVILNLFFIDLLLFFKIPAINVKYTISLSLLIYAVYCLMLFCTYLIQKGIWKIVLFSSFFVMCIKLSSIWFFDLYYSNIFTSLSSILLSVLIIFFYVKQAEVE